MVPSQEQEVRSATHVALQRLVGGKDVTKCLDGFFAGKDVTTKEHSIEALCRIVEQGSLDRTIEVLTYLISLGAESRPAFVTALKAIVRRECAGVSDFPWRHRTDQKKLLLEHVLRLEGERFVPLLRDELAAGLAANVLCPGAWENLYEEFAWAGAWKLDPSDPEVRANTFRWSCGLEASRNEGLGHFGLAAALFTIAAPQGDHRDSYRRAQANGQSIALDCVVLERYYTAGVRRDFRNIVPISRTAEDLKIELFGAEYRNHPAYLASRRSESAERFTIDATGAVQLREPDHMRLAVNLLAHGRWGDSQRVVREFMPAAYTKSVRTRSIGPLVLPAMHQAMREERWGVAAALGQIAIDPWKRDGHVHSILSLTVQSYVDEAFYERFREINNRITFATHTSPELDSFGEYAYHQPAPPPVPEALVREKTRLEEDRRALAAMLTALIRRTVDDLLRRVIELGIPLQLDIF